MAHLSFAVSLGLKVGAGVCEHRLIDVEPQAACKSIRKEFERTPGACSEIDEEIKRSIADRPVHRCFHVVLRDMQCPDAVPIGCMLFEERLSRGLAFALQCFAALAIA